MHFWIQTVHKKSQEAFPILEAMARMLYKLCSLRYLILVFNILLTRCQGFKSIQSLKDMEDKRLTTRMQVTRFPQVQRTCCCHLGQLGASREGYRTGARLLKGRHWLAASRRRPAAQASPASAAFHIAPPGLCRSPVLPRCLPPCPLAPVPAVQRPHQRILCVSPGASTRNHRLRSPVRPVLISVGFVLGL